jgi:hypothetical protein
MFTKIALLLLIQSINAPGQIEHPVSVIATSLVITPYQTTTTSAGHSYTNCSGNSAVFGNFGNVSVNCSSTEHPPTETSVTHHIYTYYTVVRDSENSYLLSCTRRFIWDKCPTIVAGQTFAFAIKGSKVYLTDEQKANKFDLVQSVPNAGITSPSQNVSSVAGQSASVPTNTTHIRVSSNVAGADISVDGNFVGNTPSDLQLTPGKHQIVVSRDGYTPWTRQLMVSTGEINLVADLHSIEN